MYPPVTRRSSQPGYGSYEPSSVQRIASDVDPTLDQLLCTYPAGQTLNAPAAIPVRVTTPNVRMRTRVTFSLAPTGSTIDVETQANTTVLDPAFPGTLWAVLEQRLHSQARKLIPIENVIATSGSPLPVPTDTGLWGVSFEIETCGEDLFCSFTPPRSAAGNTSTAEWHVTIAYEAVQRLSDEEWLQFRSKVRLVVPNQPVKLT